MNKNQKQIIESVLEKAAPLVKDMMLNENFSGFDLIEPSVRRWIDDQIEGDTPNNISLVHDYLQATDPGYGMMTLRGEKITQKLVNAYLNDNVPWVNRMFETAISKNSKLALVDHSFGNIPVIVYFIEYNYEIPFMENLKTLYTEAESFLCDFEADEIYTNCCLDALETAKKDGKPFATIFLP